MPKAAATNGLEADTRGRGGTGGRRRTFRPTRRPPAPAPFDGLERGGTRSAGIGVTTGSDRRHSSSTLRAMAAAPSDAIIDRPVGPTVQVTGGQDHGARLVVARATAEIGRGPGADLMLTDPSAAARHVLLHRRGDHLEVEDLVGDACVNGAPVPYPLRLVPGDRVTLAGTELTLLPVRPPPPPVPGDTVPEPPSPAPGGTRAAPPIGPGDLLRVALALIALTLAAAMLIAPFAPVARDAAGDALTIWMLEPSALLAQAVVAGWLAAAAALVAAAAARTGAGDHLRAAVPPVLALAGGLGAGLPLALIALRVGSGPSAGVAALLLVAVALVGCGVAFAMLAPPRATDPPSTSVTAATVVCAGAAALLVVSGPLPWVAGGAVALRGTDDVLRAGWGAIACGLVLALATLGVIAGLRRSRRAAAAGGAALLGAAGASLAFTVAAATRLAPLDARAGLVLALGAAACATAAAGTAAAWLAWISARTEDGSGSGREAWPTTS